MVCIQTSKLDFTYVSISEQTMTPEQFAEVLCDDLDLPAISFVPAIASSIRQQIDAFPTDNLLDDQMDQRVVLKVYINLLFK